MSVRWRDDLPDEWEDVDDVPVTLEKQQDPAYPHVLRERDNAAARVESDTVTRLTDAL